MTPKASALIGALALFSTATAAQVRPNAVALELGGAGGAYSIVYERAFTPDVRAELGAAYIGPVIVPASVYVTPALGRLAGRVVRADVGVGLVVGLVDGPSLYSGGDSFEDGTLDIHILPTASAGARVELGRVDLRGGVVALYGVLDSFGNPESEVFLAPRVSAAYRF